jgi:hypothetical protein
LTSSDIGGIVGPCIVAMAILVGVTIYGYETGNPWLVFEFMGAVALAACAAFLDYLNVSSIFAQMSRYRTYHPSLVVLGACHNL